MRQLLFGLLFLGVTLHATSVKKHQKLVDVHESYTSKNDASSKIKPDARIKDLKDTVILRTTAGVIELKLYPKIAPLAVENFVTHVHDGYYNGVIFHRVIKDFLVQSGDPTGTGRGGESIWKQKFQIETSPTLTFDKPFLLAMANNGPMTNGSQFFITTDVAPWLNGKYTIFGKVIRGRKVVKKLETIAVDSGDRPMFKIYITRAYLKKQSSEKQNLKK